MKGDRDNLLEINPDQLFKELTVAELQNVQKQIHSEIERKREELRTTVGEKYRDLLKAADTITDMRQTSRTVVSCINNVTTLCHALQEKHLIGFKTLEPPITAKKIYSSDDVSTVLEIKILLTMPERIWTAIDEKRFAYAAELYLLAAHTHLGVQVSRAIEKYPLVNSQWNTIIACRGTVLQSAVKELKETTLSTTSCTDCIVCILFLEPKTLEQALRDYLQLRAEAFTEILRTDENPTVKDKLRAAILLVQHTLLVTCNCFLGNPGLIEEEIKRLVGKSSQATLTKFPAISPLAERNLSQVIKEFKPSTLRPVQSLASDVVRSCIDGWIKKIQEILQSEMHNLLGLVGNLRGIVGVRERVSSVPVPSHWNAVENILGPFNVYTHIVEPHVSARTIQLVSNVWKETITALHESLKKFDDGFNTKDGTGPAENNVRWFIWKEFETDEVSAQVRGCTPRVAELCQLLDKRLQALLEDVNIFVADVKDKQPLLEFLNSNSYDTIQQFSASLIETVGRKVPTEASIIIRARLLQAMTSQCPHLKTCIHQSDRQEGGSSRTWSEIVNVLYEASIAIWRVWLKTVTPNIENLVREKLDQNVSVPSFLLSRPACETITITEETDDNKVISSELKIPSQPSFSLQELLLQICLQLNAVAVHTLPRVIHLEIITGVINLILGHYDKLSSMDTIYQSHAWQLLLDIRFLTLLFLPRDCQSTSQALWSRLEAIIDPFDLNVYLPYIQANVRKSVIRLQGTFGVLVDQSEKLAFLNSLKVEAGPQTSSPEDPNVLALSVGVPYFTLLPISSGGARKKEESPSKQGKQRSKEIKKESAASTDFVKSAGAFFGGLTGGWS